MKKLILSVSIVVCLLAVHAPAFARDHDDRDRRTEDAVREVDALYDRISAERRDFGSNRHIDEEIAQAHDSLSHIHSALRNRGDRDRIRDDVQQVKADLYHVDREIRSFNDRERGRDHRGVTLRFGK